MVTGVSKNIVGRYLAWNWIREKWDQISSLDIEKKQLDIEKK